jgi:hypothetical protein
VTITVATVRIGEAVWRAIAPVKLIKQARNRRRVRRGLPPIPITQEDETMFKQGTMTYTGTGIAAFGPMITMGLQMFGIGECTPEALEMGCIGASAITGAIVTLVGAGVAVLGKIRAAKRERQAIAAAAAAAKQFVQSQTPVA